MGIDWDKPLRRVSNGRGIDSFIRWSDSTAPRIDDDGIIIVQIDGKVDFLEEYQIENVPGGDAE